MPIFRLEQVVVCFVLYFKNVKLVLEFLGGVRAR